MVLIPEAEPLVRADRLRDDWAVVRGVPANVTIPYPFRSEPDQQTADTVESTCRSLEPFEVTFGSVGRFPGPVVWPRPAPSEPFSALIETFAHAFPDHPPYGGTVPIPLPNLTVANGVDEFMADELERKLIVGPRVSSVVEQLTLLAEGADRHWSVAWSWPLGSSLGGGHPGVPPPPWRPAPWLDGSPTEH